jgi:hypothetical protein
MLSSSEITYLQEVFSKVLRTESTPSNQPPNAFVARGKGNDAGRRNNNQGGNSDNMG